MTQAQRDLLAEARRSLEAAKLLQRQGFPGYAASRAYYAMFHVAEAFLLGKGLVFSSHSGVHAAFGEHLAKPGLVPQELHRYLIRGLEVRHAGDYRKRGGDVTPEVADEQIAHAEQFLEVAAKLIGPIPLADEEVG